MCYAFISKCIYNCTIQVKIYNWEKDIGHEPKEKERKATANLSLVAS